MAGKKGRSGRPSGSTSWWRNPTALAGHHLNVLIEMWLGGVPIQVAPKRWLVQPTERRHTVPPKIKRALAAMAIGHVMGAVYRCGGGPRRRRDGMVATAGAVGHPAPSRREQDPRDETRDCIPEVSGGPDNPWKK